MFSFLTTYQFISTSYKFHEPLSLVKRLRLNDDETLEMQAAHQLRFMINILYACEVSSSIFCGLDRFKQIYKLKSPKQFRMLIIDQSWCAACISKVLSSFNHKRFTSDKGQIISKGLLVFSNSPKKRTNEFDFTTTMNSFILFLGDFEDTKKSF